MFWTCDFHFIFAKSTNVLRFFLPLLLLSVVTEKKRSFYDIILFLHKSAEKKKNAELFNICKLNFTRLAINKTINKFVSVMLYTLCHMYPCHTVISATFHAYFPFNGCDIHVHLKLCFNCFQWHCDEFI